MQSPSLVQDPVITIGVPTFNSARSLHDFLSALEALDYPKNKMRIVFVDNYSTDITPSILGQFLQKQGRSYERALMLSRKSNIPQARNICIENSVGDYLLFLDSDVIPPHDTLKRMLEIFRPNLDAAIVGFPYRTRSVTRSEPVESGRSCREPYSTLTVQAGCTMFKIPLFREIGGFNTLFVFNEDMEFSVRAFRAGYQVIVDPTRTVHHLSAETSRVTRRGTIMTFLFVLKSKGLELLPSRRASLHSPLLVHPHQLSLQNSLPAVLCLAFWKAAVTLLLIVFYSASFAIRSLWGQGGTIADAIGLSWLGLPLIASFVTFSLQISQE